jgi:hypothetical protein
MNAEAKFKERLAKSFEQIGRELKRHNDIELMKADAQHKRDAALFDTLMPAFEKLVGGKDVTAGKAPKRGRRKAGKVIQLRSPR